MIFLFSAGFLSFYFFCLVFLVSIFWGGGYYVDFYLLSLYGLDISLSLMIDYVSLGFFSCVSLISSVVFGYSFFYMEGGVDGRRFSFLVFLFVFSMLMLVFSGNFFVTLIGWDGLGLVSFCLVVYYSNSGSLNSGLITVFSNRLGDAFFLISFILFCLAGGWSFDSFSLGMPWLMVLFLFLGSITKSAQLPFSAWLPAAMAAPTPVSSLVHSSTLVTAGIYVLLRYNYLFFNNFFFLKVFSISTMLLAGTIACFEGDFKKIIAMSTLSQLGFMLFVLSVGCWGMAYLHMMVHAFFKSTLFLSSGSLISQLSGNQDSRFYGAFRFGGSTMTFFFVSVLCLGGFPFVVGFYSKDFILLSLGDLGGIFYTLFLLGCLLTVGYSFRLFKGGVGFSVNSGSQMAFNESSFFYGFVIFLFFVCWMSGGVMFWLFLSFWHEFCNGISTSLGLFIFLGGISFLFFLRFGFFVLNYLLGIGFLKWFSNGGLASTLINLCFVKSESSWIELSGGKGIYGLFFGLASHFNSLFSFGMKSLFFSSLVLSFYLMF